MADLAQVLVDFSTKGAFPEDEAVSAAYIDNAVLPAALSILQSAKEELETEIKTISKENAPNVDAWIASAKSIQDDIQKSKKLANAIVRRAQADEERREGQQEKERYAGFLQREVEFQDQLLVSLHALQGVQDILRQAEDLASQTRIVDAIRNLDGAWEALSKVPMDKTSRAIRLLDTECFAVREAIRTQFIIVWKALVRIDVDNKTLTVSKSIEGEDTDMEKAMEGLKGFTEVDKAAKKLWEELDLTIIQPRTDIHNLSMLSIVCTENVLSLGPSTDQSIKALLADLDAVITFLTTLLPAEIVQPLATSMMPTLSNRLVFDWLATAVPDSLDDMLEYQKTLALVQAFAERLDGLKWPGSEGLYDWVINAAKIWLTKKRESILDWTRNQLSLGLGIPVLVERVEKRMVDRDEGRELASATAGTGVTQDWDAAWDSEPDQEQATNGTNSTVAEPPSRGEPQSDAPAEPPADDDELVEDAWGWGEDDETENEPPGDVPTAPALPQPTREIKLSEKYWISSIPQALFGIIQSLYTDAANLSQNEHRHVPITSAAAGLFGLPTLVLAMYRAVSTSYYCLHPGGNMYLYNDTMWLSERFRDYLTEWNSRNDLPARAFQMVKLEPEIKILASFGRRAYTSEMVQQRLMINDLLGSSQNFFTQGISQDSNALENALEPVVTHVRNTANIWKGILPYSAWASATGVLVNTIAKRVIADVFELDVISVDMGALISATIAQIQKLDDLFIRENDQAAMTAARFADTWLKMGYLPQILEDRLVDVRFDWFESDLSLFYTVEEVVDLIKVTFEKTAESSRLIRDIKTKPVVVAG